MRLRLTGFYLLLPILLRTDEMRDTVVDFRAPFATVGIDPFLQLIMGLSGAEFASGADNECLETSTHGGLAFRRRGSGDADAG